VVISFSCTDDRSGVAVCPAPVRVATVGSGIIVPGTALDLAGNSGSTTFVLNMRSPSPPGLTAEVTPPTNPAGWNNSPVTVVFACQDAGAGIQTCPPPQSFDAEGVHEVTATASDPFGT